MPDFLNKVKGEVPKQPTSPVVIKSAPIAQAVRILNIRTLPNLQNNRNPYEGKVQSFTPDKGLYTGPLGTPVMQDITFKSMTYTDFNTGQKKTSPEIKLIDILMRVNLPTKVVKTEIQGRPGTVKEYIGEDDWQITINGFLLADNGSSPTSAIIDLKNMKRARVAIPVVCTYLNNLEIFNVVIEDFALEQEPGGYSKQAFTITAVSDQDVILQIL
jgi:hypothetical protein